MARHFNEQKELKHYNLHDLGARTIFTPKATAKAIRQTPGTMLRQGHLNSIREKANRTRYRSFIASAARFLSSR